MGLIDYIKNKMTGKKETSYHVPSTYRKIRCNVCNDVIFKNKGLYDFFIDSGVGEFKSIYLGKHIKQTINIGRGELNRFKEFYNNFKLNMARIKEIQKFLEKKIKENNKDDWIFGRIQGYVECIMDIKDFLLCEMLYNHCKDHYGNDDKLEMIEFKIMLKIE